MDGFWPGPEPQNSESPPNAPYSGLLECPCTTRMSKSIDGAVAARGVGRCSTLVTGASGCAAAIKELGAPVSSVVSRTGANASMPPGCSVLITSDPAGSHGHPAESAVAYFNTLATSTTPCGGFPGASVKMFGSATPEQTGVAQLGVWVEVDDNTLRLVITGPQNVWFGVGLNTTSMAGSPCVIPPPPPPPPPSSHHIEFFKQKRRTMAI